MIQKAEFESLFDRLATAVFSCKRDELLACFDVPVAIYYEDRVFLAATPEMIVSEMESYRDKMADRGIVGVIATVTASILERPGQSSVWVEWKHLVAHRIHVGTTFSRVLCVRTADGPVKAQMFEMLQYADPTLAQEVPWAI